MTKPKPVSSFRDNLAELEEITQALESETIDLEEALQSFERGSELVAKLKHQLEAAQLRVQEIQLKTATEKSDEEGLDKKI
ncbi:MAG: Exodeoxyribonuclease 7 small subunit [Patescibacteria group bacterium]|jgi:exodeoxyribonuclease VII small subunit|nr:Exodeoxyribonuclease 7 small subunit [Patescibacteria group bacterium]